MRAWCCVAVQKNTLAFAHDGCSEAAAKKGKKVVATCGMMTGGDCRANHEAGRPFKKLRKASGCVPNAKQST
jgi:hypothetical protein